MSDSAFHTADPRPTADHNPSPATLPDTLPSLPRYRLLEEIARGGMGVVYRADDTVLGREVAVKVLWDRFGPDADAASPTRRTSPRSCSTPPCHPSMTSARCPTGGRSWP